MKNKRDQYIKYSKKELETYVKDPKSCVKKIKTVERLTIQPWMLHDLQNSIINILGKKIGRYDSKLNGVVLDFRDTKLLNDKSTVHHDNPEFHMNIETNFYVVIPFKGAIVNGLIKHISVTEIESNVVVVIYRVFSVNILFKDKIPKELHINKEIQIRVKDFHFDNVIPYIEGELIPQTLLLSPSKNKKIHFDLDNVDSGISAEENNCTSSTSSDKKKSKPASSDDSERENPGTSKSPVKIKQEKQEVKVKQEKMSSSASEAESTHEDRNFTLKELKQEKKDSSDSEPEVRKRKFQSDSKLIKSPAKKRKTQSICSQESAKKADDSDISDFLASIKSLMSESESDKKKRKKKKHREAPEVKTERKYSDPSSEVNPKTSDAEKKKHKKSKKDKKKEDDFAASVLDLFNDSKKSAKNSSSVVTEIFTQNSFKSSESEDNTKLFQPSPTKEKKKKSEKTVVEAKTSAVQEKKQDIVPDSSHQEKKKKKKHKSKDNDFSASIMGLFDQHKSTTDETPAKNKDKKKKDKEATTVKPDSMDSDASLNKQKKKKKKDKKDDFMSSIDALFSKTQKN